MSESEQYKILSPSEALEFFNTDLGRLMLDKCLYETLNQEMPTRVMRISTETIICMAKEEFTFRHWRDTVAGVTVWKEGGRGLDRAYSCVEGRWLNL